MGTHDEHAHPQSGVSAAGQSGRGKGQASRGGGLAHSGGQEGPLGGTSPTDILGKGKQVQRPEPGRCLGVWGIMCNLGT